MIPVRILIADDHDLMRRGLEQILLTHPGWEICAAARTGTEAVAKAQQFKPDVAILDISMPELDGLAAAKAIRQGSPKTEILILSMHSSDQLIREIIEVGGRGFLVKSDSDRDLVRAVEALANHKPFFTARATELMQTTGGTPSADFLNGAEKLKDRITAREREIIVLLTQGHTSAQTATLLNISVKTVDTHRSNIMRKLNLRNTSELTRYALRNNIAEP